MRVSFAVGDDVYVREPQRFVPDCTCIVGPVTGRRETSDGTLYLLRGSVGRMGGGAPDVELELCAADIGHRIGTPISRLSGRPGHPGYDEFVRIARSWGYD